MALLPPTFEHTLTHAMTSDKAVLLKHYKSLAKNIASLSNGQACLKLNSEEEFTLESVQVTVTPRDGPYRGGKFDFEIEIANCYPASAPVVKCLTQIYHPNIDCCDEGEGDVCLNLLDELWTSDMTLEDVVQGILFLLHNPNIEDPLNSMFSGEESEEDYLENVRRSLRGEEVDGVDFEQNLPDGYESDNEEANDDHVNVQSTSDDNEFRGVEPTGSLSQTGQGTEGNCHDAETAESVNVVKPVESSVDKDDVSITNPSSRACMNMESSVDKESYKIVHKWNMVNRLLTVFSHYAQRTLTIMKPGYDYITRYHDPSPVDW